MATPSGIDAQIGYAAEGTAGTYQAPTRTIDLVSETLHLVKERIPSAGIRAARRGGSGRWFPGRQWVEGMVRHELSVANTALLFKTHLGANVITGSNPYTHTLTYGSGVESTLTIQVGRPNLAGTVDVYSYLGCHLPKMRIKSEIGKVVTVEFDVYGQHEDTSQTLAATAYPSAWAPFTFAHGALSIASAEYEFETIDLESDNGLMLGRHTHRSTNPTRPRIAKENAYRSAGGTIGSEYISTTAYNRFVNGTEAALSLVFNAGSAAQMTIAGNVRFDGDTPNVTGPEMLKQGLPFKFLSTVNDPAMLTITIINADAAA